MNILDMGNRMNAMQQFRNQVQQGWQGSQHGAPQRGWEASGREMLQQWLKDMATGKEDIPDELVKIIHCVVQQQADGVLAQHGYTSDGWGGHDDGHQRFMEVLDQLRDLPTSAEAARGIEAKFAGLTPDERKVLNVLVQRTSKRKMAEKAGMPLERFAELKKALYHKLR